MKNSCEFPCARRLLQYGTKSREVGGQILGPQPTLESKVVIFTRTWLHYVRVFAIADPFVVSNVRALYSVDWNLLQYFFAVFLR